MPKTLTPKGEAHVHYGGLHVRIPFAGVEPTSTQVIDLAIEELRRQGMKPRSRRGWKLEPLGEDGELSFELCEA